MKLGKQVGLGPGHIVLDGDPAPPPQRGTAPNVRPIPVAAKWMHGSRRHLLMEIGLGQGDSVLDGDPALPPHKGDRAPSKFSAHVYSGQTAGRIKMVLAIGGRPQSRRLCVRWGPSSPRKSAQPPPNFCPMFIVAKRLDK